MPPSVHRSSDDSMHSLMSGGRGKRASEGVLDDVEVLDSDWSVANDRGTWRNMERRRYTLQWVDLGRLKKKKRYLRS